MTRETSDIVSNALYVTPVLRVVSARYPSSSTSQLTWAGLRQIYKLNELGHPYMEEVAPEQWTLLGTIYSTSARAFKTEALKAKSYQWIASVPYDEVVLVKASITGRRSTSDDNYERASYATVLEGESNDLRLWSGTLTVECFAR